MQGILIGTVKLEGRGMLLFARKLIPRYYSSYIDPDSLILSVIDASTLKAVSYVGSNMGLSHLASNKNHTHSHYHFQNRFVMQK